MWCSVCNCNIHSGSIDHKSDQISFHSFPKDNKLMKKWILFCKRKGKINPKNAKICSKHFQDEDFENIVQFKMGLSAKRLLKPNIVPTIFAVKREKGTDVDRANRAAVRERKSVVDKVLEDSRLEDIDIKLEEIPLKISDVEEIFKIEVPEMSEHICNSAIQIDALNREITNLKQQNLRLEKAGEQLKIKNECLKINLLKCKFHKNNLEKRLEEIFTPGQVRKLKYGSKRLQWTEADIAWSLSLYSASPKAYKLLRTKQFPLPAPRTLNTWIHSHPVKRRSEIF